MNEDIIAGLSQNHGICVIALNSSFAYRDQPIDVNRIGRELGVRYVLEGSVRRVADRVRITTQLIEAEHRALTSARRYDRELTDIFSVQDEITHSIVATLAPEVEVVEMQPVRRGSPEALGAWEPAMRAQWHLARMTREHIAEALRLAAQATVLDPGVTRGLNGAPNRASLRHRRRLGAIVAPGGYGGISVGIEGRFGGSRDAASHPALAECLHGTARRGDRPRSACHQSQPELPSGPWQSGFGAGVFRPWRRGGGAVQRGFAAQACATRSISLGTT
jgi:hypothetical protein